MNHMTIDAPDAPWMEDNSSENLPYKEIEVTVSLSLSKTLKIEVNDYKVEEANDGSLSYDFSECDLYKAVNNQVSLPNELAEFTETMFREDLNLKAAGMPLYLKDAISDCKDWEVDELTVIEE